MTNRYENIFFNIVRNETSLTEVFCNLMYYKSFRNHFINYVKQQNSNFNINPTNVVFENFETERDFGEDFDNTTNEKDKKIGRGDLILSVDDRIFIFEFKIETTTKLTKNQPNGYLKYLEKENQPKDNLYFILPKDYTHKNQLNNIINDTNIFYWEDFIESLKSNGLTDIPYINDFCKVLDYYWFYYETFEFNTYESNIINNTEEVSMSNKTIPTIMMTLFEKIGIIEDKFKNKSQSNQYKDNIQYGFFLKDDTKKDILWFGVDYKFWEKSGIPLSIGIDSDDIEYLEKFKESYQKEIILLDYGDDTFYHLPITVDDEIDTNDIVKKIKEVKRVIGLN